MRELGCVLRRTMFCDRQVALDVNELLASQTNKSLDERNLLCPLAVEIGIQGGRQGTILRLL